MASVISTAQIIIFTLFIMFYIPCMATLASMSGSGLCLTTAAATTLLALAVVISLAARGILAVF